MSQRIENTPEKKRPESQSKSPGENQGENQGENRNQNQPENWFRQKYNFFVQKIKSLLKQGLTPPQISLAIAMGFIIGTFPVLGTHTILSIVLAFMFRLNQVAVYLGTWISMPIYFVLLLPSLRIGEYLSHASAMNMERFTENLKRMGHSWKDFWDVSTTYGESILHIILGWLPLAIILALFVYFFTYHLAKLMIGKMASKKPLQ